MNRPNAYQAVQREALEGRELEASLLTQAAQKLARCKAQWEARLEYRDTLNEALRYNQKLWSVFQVEVCNPENPLPESLRVDLFRLSRFIDQKTFALFADGDLKDLSAIIQINQHIAAGLLTGQRTIEQTELQSVD